MKQHKVTEFLSGIVDKLINKDKFGNTTLMIALRHCDIKAVESILRSKEVVKTEDKVQIVKVKNRFGVTPLKFKIENWLKILQFYKLRIKLFSKGFNRLIYFKKFLN